MGEVQNENFKAHHDSFQEELKNKGRSNSTVIAYAKDIEQLLNFLDKERDVTTLEEAEIEDLEAFKADLEDNNYTPKSVSRKINSTRTFFKHLLDKKVISDNPSDKLSHPKFKVKPPRVLTEMEYRALRDVSRVDVRLYSIVEILLQTGIRIGELASLTLHDIRESKSGIRFLDIKPQGSHEGRPVPLNTIAYDSIQKYIEEERPETDDDTLFVTKNGRPLLVRNIRTAIDKAFEKAGIKNAKVNDLRNTFIAHHLANGVRLDTVAKLVGHKRLSTTEKYLNLIKNKSEEEKKLQEL